jgi:hypothetical protein
MASPAIGQEVSLYAGNGEPLAYIAVDDDMTIGKLDAMLADPTPTNWRSLVTIQKA